MPVQHHLQTRYGRITGSELTETGDSAEVSLLRKEGNKEIVAA